MPIRKNKVFTVLRLIHDIRCHSTAFRFYCLCWGISYMSYCCPFEVNMSFESFLAALKTFLFVDGFWHFTLMFLGVIFFVFHLLGVHKLPCIPGFYEFERISSNIAFIIIAFSLSSTSVVLDHFIVSHLFLKYYFLYFVFFWILYISFWIFLLVHLSVF